MRNLLKTFLIAVVVLVLRPAACLAWGATAHRLIVEMAMNLLSPAAKQRVLFHLMGDITQPLHVGYGFDLGGNSVKVKTAIYNKPGNELHAVWDDIIIREGKINLQSSMAYYHNLTDTQINDIVTGSTRDWMMQARSYLPDVYDFHAVNGGTSNLSRQYLDKNVPVVQQQLVYAAVRLAHALNTSFSSPV